MMFRFKGLCGALALAGLMSLALAPTPGAAAEITLHGVYQPVEILDEDRPVVTVDAADMFNVFLRGGLRRQRHRRIARQIDH